MPKMTEHPAWAAARVGKQAWRIARAEDLFDAGDHSCVICALEVRASAHAGADLLRLGDHLSEEGLALVVAATLFGVLVVVLLALTVQRHDHRQTVDALWGGMGKEATVAFLK